MEKINVKCFTCLDDYVCDMQFMICRPIKGDKVTVLYKGRKTYLRIVDITHETEETGSYLKIELHN